MNLQEDWTGNGKQNGITTRPRSFGAGTSPEHPNSGNSLIKAATHYELNLKKTNAAT